jgi:hypothetical protein
MKKQLAIALALAASTAAHADLLVPKGAKSIMTVRYEYKSEGTFGNAAGGSVQDWVSHRVVNITAQYVADTPLHMGVMHKPDAAAQAQLNNQMAQAAALQKKMQPVANDMVAIAERCGMNDTMTPAQEKVFEACVTAAVTTYATSSKVPPDLMETSAAINALGTPGAPRYQLWRLTSLNGTYDIDETHNIQVYEMTCTNTRICKRTTVTRGAGNIPPSPAGRSIEGASMLEVDSVGKDLVFSLPAPLAPLKTETTVKTSIPNDPSKGGATFASPLLKYPQPITVRINGSALKASGTQVYPIEGDKMSKGTLTVTWTFSRN